MSGAATCGACGHPRLVEVAWLADRTGSATERFALRGLRGDLDLGLSARFCRACGRVEWWVSPEERRGVVPDSGPPSVCRSCGDPRRCAIGPVGDRVGARALVPLGAARTALAAELCLGCGRVTWALAESPGDGAPGGRCPACRGEDTLRRGVADRMSWWRVRPFGIDAGHPFEILACRSCRQVTWSVVEPRTVPLEGERIVLLQPPPPDHGPFRGGGLAEPRWLPAATLAVSREPSQGRPRSCVQHVVARAAGVHDLASGTDCFLGLGAGSGRLQVRFCRRCGEVAWGVDPAERLTLASLPGGSAGDRCAACGRDRTIVFARIGQQVGDGYLRALDVRTFPLEASACPTCLTVRWAVTPLWIDDTPGHDVCSRCHQRRSTTCAVWDWVTPDEAIPLGLGEGSAFRAHACNGCAHVDWSLDGAAEVPVDGRLVTALGDAARL